MKKTVLRAYARLLAQVGIRVKQGDEVLVFAGLDQPDFVRTVVEECYEAGAKKVSVEWSHQPLTKLHARYQTEQTLGAVSDWELEKLRYSVEHLPARLYLESDDPDGLSGIPQPKYSNALQHRAKTIKPLRDQMENKYKWCIAAVPGQAWAKKMFPDQRPAAAREKLWEAILSASRALEDPVAAWEAHNADLTARCDYLNALGIESLHYSASNGTDLTVGMIEDALFLGGGEYTLSGEYFNPNIPSEEVFITPKKGEAEGVVYSSKPLSFQGQLIENFSIRFENGRAVEGKAEKNEALLRTLIAMDEGASYLGECALVPYHSPISLSGLMFYNTLFDENAACHLALGMGFSNSIRDYGNYTLAQCWEKGVNDSILHEDFMIGTPDLAITAHTRDGREVPIFRAGDWAF